MKKIKIVFKIFIGLVILTYSNEVNSQSANNTNVKKYYVSLMLKDIEYSDGLKNLATFLCNYGLQREGLPINAKSFIEVTLNASSKMNDFINGGTPVVGTIKISKKYLEFVPFEINSLVISNLTSIRIPRKDIISCKENQSLFQSCQFELKTKNGIIKGDVGKSYLELLTGFNTDTKEEFVNILNNINK